jgi:hypothetical protein
MMGEKVSIERELVESELTTGYLKWMIRNFAAQDVL